LQVPGPSSDWLPLSPSNFIVGAASTALTIPSPLTQTPPVKTSGNMIIVGFLFPQGAAYWMRTDGVAAVVGVTTALKLNIGDYRIIYGFGALSKIRVIQDAGGGALTVEYYLYRNQPEGT
jgi:hypothetical protein